MANKIRRLEQAFYAWKERKEVSGQQFFKTL